MGRVILVETNLRQAQIIFTEPQTRPVIEEVPERYDPGSPTALQTISSPEPRLLTGNLGTLFYTAPEVLKSNSKGRSLYNQKVCLLMGVQRHLQAWG